jgi:two-component system sensor histidine kinase BaeS
MRQLQIRGGLPGMVPRRHGVREEAGRDGSATTVPVVQAAAVASGRPNRPTLDGYLEGLEDGVIEPSQATWRLLRAETGRLTRLVSDLAELWRAESRQLPLRIEAVDLDAVAREVVDRFGPLASPRGIAINLGSDATVVARADRTASPRSWRTTSRTRSRHARSGSTIVVSAAMSEGTAELAVTDQGPGLAADQLEAVFERFYRIDPARSRTAGGSGIGLAIVRALAEAMGGRAWAESAGPRAGATFRLELPAA